MQSLIKLNESKYNQLAGADWPLYENYISSSFSAPPNILAEIKLHERVLKYPIDNINRLIDAPSYSQAGQDLFVIALLQGKLNGTFLELGAGHPVGGNNTFLLENYFGYSGTSIDIDDYCFNEWKSIRPSTTLHICDALTFDYSTVPHHVDYLQVDIEPPINNLIILEKLLESHTFGVITFEHDVWRHTSEVNNVRKSSRTILSDLGYVLVVNDVTIEPGYGVGINDEPIYFEDWYANPQFVPIDVINAYKNITQILQPKYKDSILYTR